MPHASPHQQFIEKYPFLTTNLFLQRILSIHPKNLKRPAF